MPACGCPDAGGIRLATDSDQRTIATAVAYGDVLAPGAGGLAGAEARARLALAPLDAILCGGACALISLTGAARPFRRVVPIENRSAGGGAALCSLDRFTALLTDPGAAR